MNPLIAALARFAAAATAFQSAYASVVSLRDEAMPASHAEECNPECPEHYRAA